MAAFVITVITVFTSLVIPILGNDLPFLFGHPLYYEVNEDAKVGYIVGNITAKDVNSADTLTLSLDSIGDELFEIVDSSGTKSSSGKSLLTRYLRLKKALDREARASYDFQIIVEDDHLQPSNRETKTTFTLIVRDVNDNKPVFQETPYTAEIKENTPSVLIFKVTATDADLGSAKSVQYSFSDDCKLTDCKPFVIGSTLGKVSLKTSITLDYEKKNRYNLDIVAKDRGVPSLNSSTTLVVAVTDQSDRPPEFEKSSYRADIAETIPVGFAVVQIKAFDGDRGINNPVKYAIIRGDVSHYFKIDNTTGLISTNSTIDRDTGNDFFELTVEATEIPGNASSATTVFVTIEDTNDNKPTFPTTDFSASIPEDTPINTPIFFQMGAFDNDREAKNARFGYSIVGDPGRYFKIDPNIGRIELNRTVDFETQQQYTFVVVAKETSSVEKFSANQTITINITNVNDNQPQFNQTQYNFSVIESTKSGTVLGQITATDDDSGKLGELTYSLSGDGAERFSVTEDNGTIFIASSPDFETKQSYSLKFEATDGGNRVTRVPLLIIITDANDNTPKLEPFPSSVNLDENKENITIFTVKASDKDSGNNSVIKYFIVGGDPLNNFTINVVSGKIKNTVPLDFETKSNFSLIIMAEDEGSPSRNTTETLFVKVNDRNDNAPYFKQTFFNDTLLENTDIDHHVVELHAVDKDSGKNAEIVYSIVSGNDEKKFTINADGLLLTRSSPDRETTDMYTLNISASDSGTPKLYAYAKVIVNILDENDESPRFRKTVDKVILKEGASSLNVSVANNTAIDDDLGLNGTIGYIIKDGNTEGMFVINPRTGQVTVAQKLDFETVRIYSLKIVASDKGTPPRSGEYQLVVEVSDINDNSPLFGQPEYSFTVMENRPNGTEIVTLRADDRDGGDNKIITYSFSFGNVGSAFEINNATGQISTRKELDRETENRYLLVVKAKDHGNPALEGTTNVTITVLDENDEIPQFTKPSYNISIPETTAKGTGVYTLTATDADDGPAGQVTYLMQDYGNLENGNSVFSVGSKSGEVKTAIKLDFEIHRGFTLTVTASDNGAPAQSSNVTLYVIIKDADDNAPAFTKNTWSAVVNENASVDAVVTQVNATDVDFESAHRTVYYVIVGGNDDGVFGIGNESGVVYVAGKLDRETKSSYEVIIEARTLNEFKNVTVQQTTTKLTITVEDHNDHSPVFQQSSYEKKIPESFELNEIIVTIVADDKDTGKNKDLSYFISAGNDDGIFAINTSTGDVTIVKRLDRETTPAHTLIVTARDHGTPSLASNVSVVVSVTDTNDKRPKLIIQDSKFPILENATVGTVVTKFHGTDEDMGKNAVVGYQIVSGNTDGMFGLNNETGEFFTAKQLDYEMVNKYEIGVQAFDHGSPNLQSVITIITINVKDVNDNEPTFKSQRTITMIVPENLGPGAMVGTVKGADNDETDALYYYMRGGNGASYFSIDESSGDVTTTAELDREKNATYFIYVQVFNSKQTPEFIQNLRPIEGTPRRRKRAVDSNVMPVIPVEQDVQLVTINIADTNDNPPYFKNDFYKAGVSENAEYQSRITQITCVDNDIGNNSRLIYKALNLNPPELLSVEPETGWILAGQQQYFASGVGKTYSFSYSCEDLSYNATTSVTIFVLVDDQRVRLTLGLNDTKYVRDNIDAIKDALDKATGLEFNVDSIQYHLQGNGRYDLSKTDIFMHAVDPMTNRVVDKETVLKLIDTNYGKLIEIFQKYKVNAVEAKNQDNDDSGFDAILAAAIVLGIILFMLLLCFLCVVCLMRKSHNRKLRAAKAIGSQDQSYGLTTPGTNLHVYEGSNPIWMDPYDNWKVDDDKTSSNAKLYEAQELSMDMFRDDSPESRVLPGTFYESTNNGAAYHPNGIINLGRDENDEEEVTNI